MASETHNVKKRNFCNNTEDHSIDLPRKRISNFTNKNMKEVKKSPKQLAAYITRTVGQAVKSPDKLRKTESPSSKYSGFFSEVSQDHETMAQVLFSRNLRLNVALTFWRKRSISELVAYLVRIEDLGVVVDCLPVLTNSLQEEKQYISLGCCVDLLPLVKSLLKSRFEEYIIVGLNWLQAVIKRWWSELSSKTEVVNDGNIQILKQQLSGLWEQENHLTLVPGYTGNIAKDVDAYLLQLH